MAVRTGVAPKLGPRLSYFTLRPAEALRSVVPDVAQVALSDDTQLPMVGAIKPEGDAAGGNGALGAAEELEG